MMGVNSSPGSAATLQIRCPPARLLHPRGKCAPNEAGPTTPRPDPTGLLGQVVFQLPRGAEFPNSINNITYGFTPSMLVQPVLSLLAGSDPHGSLAWFPARLPRSEEHTSELQSLRHLVCRLLLEKKKHT